jgi:hypothetical protein
MAAESTLVSVATSVEEKKSNDLTFDALERAVEKFADGTKVSASPDQGQAGAAQDRADPAANWWLRGKNLKSCQYFWMKKTNTTTLRLIDGFPQRVVEELSFVGKIRDLSDRDRADVMSKLQSAALKTFVEKTKHEMPENQPQELARAQRDPSQDPKEWKSHLQEGKAFSMIVNGHRLDLQPIMVYGGGVDVYQLRPLPGQVYVQHSWGVETVATAEGRGLLKGEGVPDLPFEISNQIFGDMERPLDPNTVVVFGDAYLDEKREKKLLTIKFHIVHESGCHQEDTMPNGVLTPSAIVAFSDV